MSPEAWGFAGLLATNFFGLIAVYVQNHRQGTNVQELHTKVEPVSNGFASHVMASLGRIESRLDDHMRGHP